MRRVVFVLLSSLMAQMTMAQQPVMVHDIDPAPANAFHRWSCLTAWKGQLYMAAADSDTQISPFGGINLELWTYKEGSVPQKLTELTLGPYPGLYNNSAWSDMLSFNGKLYMCGGNAQNPEYTGYVLAVYDGIHPPHLYTSVCLSVQALLQRLYPGFGL